MKLVVEKGGKLTKLFEIIAVLHEEGNFVFDLDKLTLMQTDLAKVSMVKVVINKPFFKTYEVGEVLKRRYDVSTLAKFIGKIDTPVFIAEGPDESLSVKVGNEYVRKVKVYPLEGFEELPVLPELNHEIAFTCPIAVLRDALNDCTIVSEDFLFKSDENVLTVRGESPHLGEVSTDFNWGVIFAPKRVAVTSQAYNALLLLDFIKSLEKSGVERVDIEFGRDKPLRLYANLENVSIEYTLGHMIMEEGRSEA